MIRRHFYNIDIISNVLESVFLTEIFRRTTSLVFQQKITTMHSRMNVRKVGVQESKNGFGEKILSKKTLFSKEINI